MSRYPHPSAGFKEAITELYLGIMARVVAKRSVGAHA